MKHYWWIAGLLGLLLAGCGEQPPPKVSRSTSQSRERAAAPASGHWEMAEAAEPGGPEQTGGTVRLDTVTLRAPDNWKRKQPRSSFVSAEFSLPAVDGAGEGRLTVSSAGGSVEANIERWKGQFSGSPASPREERLDTPAGQVTLVDLAGEFNDQPGPFAPAAKRPDYRMIAAIIPGDGQLHFVKAVGPQKTIAARADEVKAFVRSVKRN